MYWTLDLISILEGAPFPATKEELLDYAARSGAPHEVTLNLLKIEEEEDRIYVGLQDIWPDMPLANEDFLFNQDEY